MADFDASFDAAFLVAVGVLVGVVVLLYYIFPRPRPRLEAHARYATREHRDGACRNCLIVNVRNIGTAGANVIDVWLESPSGRRESLDVLGMLPQLPRGLAPFDSLRIHVMNVDLSHALKILRPKDQVFRVIAQARPSFEGTSGWIQARPVSHAALGVPDEDMAPRDHRDTNRAHKQAHAHHGRRMHPK